MIACLGIACLVLILGGLLVGAAPPPRPATFYGPVKINGANPPLWVTVEALIGGVPYASTGVRQVGADMVYAIDVPGDTDEPGKQGGGPGDTIQFRVGGLICDQTAIWQEGTYQNLPLTATGALPTATPTPTQPPSPTPTNTLIPTDTPIPTNTPIVTPAPTSVDFTPANTTVKDTYISEWDPNTNFGTAEKRFRIRVYGPAFKGLLYFDTYSIPSDARVTSASLHLYLDNYDDGKGLTTVTIHKVLTDWDDQQATWNHRLTGISWSSPGCSGASDRSATPSNVLEVSKVSTWYVWDITTLVQEWVWNPSSNKGMLLVGSTWRDLRFNSGDDTARQPYLHVEYTPGGSPPPTSSVTPSPSPSAQPTDIIVEIRNPTSGGYEAYISSMYPTTNYVNQLRVYGPGVNRSLLKFPDVSQIPTGAEIISATLKLTTSNYNDGKTWGLDVGAYRVKRYWDARWVTWQEATTGSPWRVAGCDGPPEDRDPMPVDVQTLQEVSTGTKPYERVSYRWNVRDIVQAWVDDPASRDAGLMLMSLDGPYRNIGFWSSSYLGDAGRDLHPVLIVRWRPRSPTPTPSPTTSPTPSSGSIEGTIYFDRNRNGSRDVGENGVLGVTVQLLSGSTVVLQKNTPGSGMYRFDDIAAGSFAVRVLFPTGG